MLENQPLSDRGKGFGFGILLASLPKGPNKGLNLTETRQMMLKVLAKDLDIDFEIDSLSESENYWEFLEKIKNQVSNKSESAASAFDLACHLVGLPGTQEHIGASLTLEMLRETQLRKLTAQVGLQWRVVEGLYQAVKDGTVSTEQLDRISQTTFAHILRTLEGFVSVFLSYSQKDKAFALALRDALRDHGIKVWIDEGEIRVGDSLVEKIAKAIENSDFVVPIISTTSVKSEWVRKELSLAMTKEISQRRVQILPVLKDDCEIPSFLKDKLNADFSNPERFAESVTRLVGAMSLAEPGNVFQSPREFVSDLLFDIGLPATAASADNRTEMPKGEAYDQNDNSPSGLKLRAMFGTLAAACIRAGIDGSPLPAQTEEAVRALESSGSPFESLGALLRGMAKGDIPDRLHSLFKSDVAPYIDELLVLSSQAASTVDSELSAAMARIEAFLYPASDTEASFARLAQLALLDGELSNADAYAHRARDQHEQLHMTNELVRDYATLAYIAQVFGNEMLAELWEAKLQKLNCGSMTGEVKEWVTATGLLGTSFEQLIEPHLHLAWLALACLRAANGSLLPEHAEMAVTVLETAGKPYKSLGAVLRDLTKGKLPAQMPDALPSVLEPILAKLISGQ